MPEKSEGNFGEQAVEGVAVELLPAALVRVRLVDGEEVTAHVAEEFRRVYVSVRPGDRVKVKKATRNSHRAAIVGVIR